MDVARVTRTAERFKDHVPLVETGVHEGHRIGRNVALAGERLECPQHITSLVRPSGLCKQIALERERLAVAPARESLRVRQRVQREIDLARSLVRLAELQD